jgi:hypothetical protein
MGEVDQMWVRNEDDKLVVQDALQFTCKFVCCQQCNMRTDHVLCSNVLHSARLGDELMCGQKGSLFVFNAQYKLSTCW